MKTSTPFFLTVLVAAALTVPSEAKADGRRHGHGDWHGYGNHSYSYHRGYHRPYYYGPSFGVSVYPSPFYYSRTVYLDDTPTYRGVERAEFSASDSLAVDVQRALSRRGFYRGPIDGDIGPGSRAAIRAYQDEHGLAVTGRIDQPLLRSLGLS